MANRAYLISANECAYPRQDDYLDSRNYFDSRWTIPISWWLLFDVESLRTVARNGGDWYEPYCVRRKSDSIAALDRHQLIVRALIRNRLTENYFLYFLDMLKQWPDDYLVMDVREIVEDEEKDTVHFRKILTEIDGNDLTAERLIDLTQPYSSIGSDPERFDVLIFGYSYGELASTVWQRHFPNNNE